MLSSSLVSITQIVVVTGAILFVLCLGDAALVSQIAGWMGRLLRRIAGTTKVSKDRGVAAAREN